MLQFPVKLAEVTQRYGYQSYRHTNHADLSNLHQAIKTNHADLSNLHQAIKPEAETKRMIAALCNVRKTF